MAAILESGSKAPGFTLPDKDGNMVSLGDFIGKSSIVLFFYPRDESYGCTREACSFRDQYEVFKEAGAEVIGISSDDERSHQSFATRHRLPYLLLSDVNRQVAELYGVGKTLGIFPGRVTFVIDREGFIRKKFSSQLNFEKHISESLETLKSMP